MDEALIDEVLKGVLHRDRTSTLDLRLTESGALQEAPRSTGREIDEALRELEHRGWMIGDRGEGDGSIVWWSQLRPTVLGLRHLGEYPPAGQEYVPGGWDDRTWGKVDRARLSELDESPPFGEIIEQPSVGNARDWASWEASLRLREAGLIDAEYGDGLLSSVRLTTAGQHVLHPPDDDPLVRARLKLRQGAKADAVTAAIDEALKPRLIVLAIGKGIQVADMPDKLSNLNDRLKGLGAYGASRYAAEAVRAQVEAWIKLRNVVDHGEGSLVDDRRVELLIDGIEQFLEQHQ